MRHSSYSRFQLSVAMFVLMAMLGRAIHAAEPSPIDFMDAVSFKPTADKARAELVDGKVDSAIKFSFGPDCRNVYLRGSKPATPAWDQAEGISFWVKGDGSSHLGGIEFVWNDDFAVRYACAFPINGAEWQKVVIPWRDLLPETTKAAAQPLNPSAGNAPSKLSAPWFGKWWYWRDYAAHSYAVDEFRLEPKIELDLNDYRPAGDPLARTSEKLKVGKPLKIVTMGDSLTDYLHWANRQENWPTMLKKQLESTYKSQVTIINPAIGGTELVQNLVLMPRWTVEHADADLVIVCFGGNDWGSGMRGPLFTKVVAGAIDRIRHAAGGKADVLFATTCPSAERWETMSELADACRQATREKNAGLADIEKAIHAAGKSDPLKPFVRDKVHLSPVGHAAFAQEIFDALSPAN